MNYQDSIHIDNELMEQLREKYNYDSQFATSGRSLTDVIGDWINRFLESIFGNEVYTENKATIWISIATVLVITLAVIIMLKRPTLFRRDSKADVGEDAEEDNIYGVDFDGGIECALRDGNHREAVRLVYLKTLRLLSDTRLINWQLFKTPTQYAREYRNAVFRQMTAVFMRVRYGDYEATADTYHNMASYANEIATAVENAAHAGTIQKGEEAGV